MVIPSVYIKSVTFSDGTSLDFNSNDVIVFVGANNAGKSVALRNIKEISINNQHPGLVITKLVVSREGTENDLVLWLEKNFHKNIIDTGNTVYSTLGSGIDINTAKSYWLQQVAGLQSLSNFFIHHLTTDTRLNAANPAPNIALTQDAFSHPIHYLQASDNIELKLSGYFRQAFGEDLIVHRNAGNQVPLYCGKRPIPKEGQDRISFDYLKTLEMLPTLHTQGDGMRSFMGVLLNTFIDNHTVLLIDEPDAFLHPPQARLLGRMLINELPDNKQVFIATHSGDFLRGLLDTESSRLRVIRLQRNENVNIVSELNNTKIKSIWRDPILRYSNVLDGLFHNRVVVCEGDSDCRFYAAMYDAASNSSDSSPKQDIMFIHCGGKTRMPVIVESLYELKVPLSVICDFDILNAEEPLRSIYEQLGGDWSHISSDWSLVKSSIEQKKSELSTGEVVKKIGNVLSSISESMFPKSAEKQIQAILRRSSPWSIAKENGKSFIPSGNPTQAYIRLHSKLVEKGLFIIEVGELEGFARSVGNHGPKWVNTVLEKNLLEDPELEQARQFITTVIKQTL